MGQYTLPFSQPACYSKDNFFVSDCNINACKQIQRWPEWQAMLLTGPAGSGKTHLGYVWAAAANAYIINGKNEPLEPASIHSHLLVDGIESIEDTVLFHTINLCKEQGYALLLTANAPVKQLNFTLPDLTSRLLAMPAARIDNPDDDALAGVMRKQFADRQIGTNEEVIHYLLGRCERSFATISDIVSTLDAAMWEQKKNLTIPFVRKIMDSKAGQESA